MFINYSIVTPWALQKLLRNAVDHNGVETSRWARPSLFNKMTSGWPSCYRIRFFSLCICQSFDRVQSCNRLELSNHHRWHFKHYSKWRNSRYMTEQERKLFRKHFHVLTHPRKWFMQNDSREDDENFIVMMITIKIKTL